MLYTPYIWPFIIAILLELGIIFYVLRFKDVPAARPYSFMLAAGAGWALTYGLAISTVNLPDRIFLGNCAIFFTTLTVFTLLIMVVEYIGQGEWLTRRRMQLLFIIPLIITLAGFTSQYHALFRYNYSVDLSGNFSALIFSIGPLYYLYVFYIIFTNFFSVGLLINTAIHQRRDFGNTTLISLGVLIPTISGIMFALGKSPIPHYDLGAAFQVFTGLFTIIGLAGGRFLDVAHIARDQIIDNIQDLILVMDQGNNIVEMNRAAQNLLDTGRQRSTSTSPIQLPPPWADLLQRIAFLDRHQEEVLIIYQDKRYIYDLTISPIIDSRSRRLGRTILLHDITERKMIEDELRESEEKFRRLVETTDVGLYIYNGERFVVVNSAFEKISGYSRKELLEIEPLDLIHPTYREMVQNRAIIRLKGGEAPGRYEVKIVTKEKEEMWVELSIGSINYQGKPAVLATFIDVTIRKKLEENLRTSQRLYLDIVEDQTDPVGRWLPDTTVTFVNQAHCNYFGLTRTEYVGKRFILDLPLETQKIVRNAIQTLLEGRAETVSTEEINFSPLGEKRWAVWVYRPIRDASGNIVEFQSVGRDITDRKRMEHALEQANEELMDRLENIQLLQAQLMEQAIRDALTGLFNRRYMEETLEREIAGAIRRDIPISIIMLDLDSFKKINDTNGHKAGDLVLQSVGQILLTQTRQMDVACRFGGEEFVVIMPTITLEAAALRAEALRKAIQNLSVEYENHVLKATCSVGVAAFPLHGQNGDAVLRAADDAMYLAKAAGRNRVVVHAAHPVKD